MNKISKCDNCPYLFVDEEPCRGKGIKTCNVTREELQKQIKETLDVLYKKEFYLFEKEVNEVCIVAHFWRYFLNKFQQKYEGLDMDIEYNRTGDFPKYYGMSEEEHKKYAKPDMIIHKRGCNFHNLVYMEFKAARNSNEQGRENDVKKLNYFTKQEVFLEGEERKYCYKYKYGICLELYNQKVMFRWYEDGKYMPEFDYTWEVGDIVKGFAIRMLEA